MLNLSKSNVPNEPFFYDSIPNQYSKRDGGLSLMFMDLLLLMQWRVLTRQVQQETIALVVFVLIRLCCIYASYNPFA